MNNGIIIASEGCIMQEKKTNLLAVLQVLKDYTDENHILSQKEIAEHLNNEYGLTIDRRTVYKDIRMLIDFGYDISTYAENEVGYYLKDREFSNEEMTLICNAISSADFISEEQADVMVEKMLKSQSEYNKENFRNKILIHNNNKNASSENYFSNAERINEAIQKKEAVTFDLLKYDRDKNLIKKREEPYVVSPYQLVKVKDITYLLGRLKGEYRLSHYRLDKMADVSADPADFVEMDDSMDLKGYVRDNVFMEESMETRVIRLICSYEILDDLIDLFGRDLEVREYNKDYFLTTVKVSKQAMIYIALQYVDHLEIIEPKELREEMKRFLFKGNMKYI